MISAKEILILAAFAIGMMMLMYFIYTGMTKQQKMSAKEKVARKLKRYHLYYDAPIIKQTFRRIDSQLAALGCYSYLDRQVAVVKAFEKAMITSVAMFIVAYVLLGDLLSGIILFFFCLIVMNNVINNNVDEVNYTTLRYLSRYIQSVREAYTRVRNVPDAINEAACPQLLKKHVDALYQIVTAPNAEERLENFYTDCTQRTLKTLATTCYIRADSGDDTSNGKESSFKKALSLIKSEVDQEVLRLLNQRLMFKGLANLPFAAIIVYPVAMKFYVNFLPASASYFHGTFGYFCKIFIILMSAVCYYAISAINNTSMAATDDRLLFIKKWDEKKKVHLWARTLFGKPRAVDKLDRMIRTSLSKKKLEYIYLEKLFFAIVGLVSGMAICICVTIYVRTNTYNSLVSSDMSVSLSYTKEQEKLCRDYEHKLLRGTTLPSDDVLREFYQDVFPRENSTTIQVHLARIKEKFNTYKSAHFYWYFAIISWVAAIACWYVPDMLLKMRQSMVKSESEMDVLQLQTIIAVLMDTPVDTYDTLYWMYRTSDIHKHVLMTAFHNYMRDPEIAIAELKLHVTSNEFQAMCDKLLTTISQVSLAEAFEDLVAERENQMKTREVVQMAALKKKRSIASPFATTPFYLTVLLAFLAPLIVTAVKTLMNAMSNLG